MLGYFENIFDTVRTVFDGLSVTFSYLVRLPMTIQYLDLAKCMYCGICSEVCPTGAIRHSQEFEGACYDPVAMARHFVLDFPVAPFKPTKGGETDSALARKVEIGKDYMDVFAQPK